MKLEQKSQIIDAIAKDLAEYSNVYVTDISGFTVETVNQLRRLCFRKDVKIKVVKNTLLKRAMDQSEVDFSELYPALEGSTSIMLSNTGNAPAKLIKEFRATSPKPLLKAAYVEESFYLGDANLDVLINIKSKVELIADIIAALQSPAKNVIGALQSGGGTIAGVLKTLSKKTEE